jgi:hypothetical protein
MAIQKKHNFYPRTLECEIWRIDNVHSFRDRALFTVAGWLSLEHYEKDNEKLSHIQAKQFVVEDRPQVLEQQDENGDVVVAYQAACTDFTDYFSDATLIQSGKSPRANAYKYLMTLPEFAGGKKIT